jgi:SAM-dependent methyltransferase
MERRDARAQLLAVDRWASRKRRSIQFLRQNGIGGLISKIHSAGVGGIAGLAKRQLRYQLCSYLGSQWDRRYGVDTSGQIDLPNVEVLGPNRDGGYSAVSTSPQAYAFLSAFFPADWKKFTFVDIGCGKGRVLLLAALRGFETIIGIEFAPLICQVAEQNLANFSGPRPVHWSVINADATTIVLPSDVPLLIYCFNPFKAEVWKSFMPVLLKGSDSNRKPLCLVLSGTIPAELHMAADIIESTGRFLVRAKGVTPSFRDAYAPYHYWVFDAI